MAFALEIVADAWLTGPWSPVSTATSLAQALSVAFVVLGDLRYFVLIERDAAPRRAGSSVAIRAVGWSILVPLAVKLAMRAAPALFANPRAIFLVYELLFVALLLVLRAVVLPRRATAAQEKLGERNASVWIARLTTFELVQYGLWATADIVLLARGDDNDVGLAIRIFPNLMYYVFFLVFVAVTAPRSSRE